MSNNIFHLCDHIGEVVTIFTASGGKSGCGFTGVLLSVNSCFVRLMTREGTPPSNPLAENICPDMNGPSLPGTKGCGGMQDMMHKFNVGSVCDIPIDKIVSFCHNAV